MQHRANPVRANNPQARLRAAARAALSKAVRKATPSSTPKALPEALEPRRLLATTLTIPVPAALDGHADMGPVVDLPGGFGPVWLLDTTGPTIDVFSTHFSTFHDERGIMEFPLAGVPNGSRIESARLRYNVVLTQRSPEDGGFPSLQFTTSAGDGKITVEEFSNPSGPEFAVGPEIDAPLDDGPNVVTLNAAAIQNVIGRASHLKVLATGEETVVLSSAEGAAASGGTRPTLELTFTPPAQPAPAPTPFPSGTITGQAFTDTDADGSRDASEAPATQVKAFLDRDRDGVWDGDEFSTNTDAAGNFRFTGLTAGTYRVALHVPADAGEWRQTAPSARFFDVTLATNQSAASLPGAFGLHTNTVQIRGTSFEDADGDGARDASEKPAAGRLIFIDQNNNGAFDDDLDPDGSLILQEPHTFTDTHGDYFFYNQNPGTHVVREDLPPGWQQTAPSSRAHVVTLSRGQVATGKNFGSTRTNTTPSRPGPAPLPQDGASISGTVFEDDDSDGVRDPDESGAAHARVYVDENRNGVWDRGSGPGDFDEPWVLSGPLGNYRLALLAPGTYRVRLQDPSPEFGLRVTAPASGSYDVTVSANQSVTGKHFGIGRAEDSISGFVFEDEDGDGTRDAGEGPTDGLVYLDLNRDGQWQDGFDGGAEEPLAIADDTGRYGFAGLPAGNYRVRILVPLSGWRQTAPASGFHDVTVTAGGAVANRNFGLQRVDTPPPPPPEGATIAGTVFDDTDGDGTRDAGEEAVRSALVYLDLNRDGVWQDGFFTDEQEPSAHTNDAGAYRFEGLAAGTYRVRHEPSVDFKITAPASGFHDVTVTRTSDVTGKHFGVQFVDPDPPAGDGVIAGTVYRDNDADGVKDAGEPGIANTRVYLDEDGDISYDVGEQYVFTDANGNYRLVELPPGEYRVCEAVPAGLAPTSPAQAYHGVTLAKGQTVTGRNFGNAPAPPPATGSVAGTVFADADADGRLDAGETLLSGRRVFVDANRNGVLDSGERSTTSGADGSYRLTNLPAGTHRVRRVMPEGYRLTTPSAGFVDVSLAAGQAATGKDFGAARVTAPPPFTLTLQAEGAARGGAVLSTEHAGFAGSGFVDFLNASGDFVEFTASAPAAGTYELSFRYANGSRNARAMGLSVNGASRPAVSLASTGSWTGWGTATVTVQLTAGANKIRLTATGQSGPNLDALTITRKA